MITLTSQAETLMHSILLLLPKTLTVYKDAWQNRHTDRQTNRQTDRLTRPFTVLEMSISVMSCMKLVATEHKASSGHSENQSMVQQFTRLGNWRRRERNTSPIGL